MSAAPTFNVVCRLVLGALLLPTLNACAGSLEGEVDGDAVPPLLSGFWSEGDAGDLFQVSATASSVLDLCGSQTALTREMVEVVKTMADEVDEDDDADDVYDDLRKASEEAWERYLPEDFWTVSATILIKDEDDFVDDYDLGEDADIDLENPAFAGVSVCHQEGFLELDDDGSNDNLTCFTGTDGELEVVAFDDKGSIEVVLETELAESDDLEEDVGDIKASVHVGRCESLDDATKDLEDANEDLRDALAGDDNPPSEGEGEGEGEDVTCSSDSDCLTGNSLCDLAYGICVDPALVTGGCTGSSYLSSRAPEGPVLYAPSEASTTTYCDDEVTVTFYAYDANDDIGTSPYVRAVDDDGYTVSVMSTTSYGTSLAVKLCPDAATPPFAIQIEDGMGYVSNALCTSP